MRRLLCGIAVLAALIFVLPGSVAAQQRIALVIGNAAYPGGPLATSLADGGLVAEALTSIGFEIVEGADVNQNDMRRIFRDFLDKVQAAGPDAIALVYYSGYAVPFEGENYLIPADARLARDSDIPIEAVRLFDLMRPLADAPSLAKIVILDAARPLPFRIQGGRLARGLSAIESAPGLLVAFSAAPGEIAEDAPGPYGAYATAIAEMVREPGLDLDTMFARIRVRTHEATNGAQTPWEVSQLDQVVMLVPGAPSPSQALSAPQAATGAARVRRVPRPMTGIGPEEAYIHAIEQDDLPTYVEYVRIYPNSPYAQRIWARIRARREALAWRRALLFNTREAYWTYLERYPDGMYAYDAERRLRRLSAGLRPPPGFRMLDFHDAPPPVAGEPARLFDVYPAAPPPPRRLAPPPAFIVTLPPPRRDRGGGLWHRQQQTFPVIIAPPAGTRPGIGGPARQAQPPQAQQPQGQLPQGQRPAVVTQPPPGAPSPAPGSPPSGQKGSGSAGQPGQKGFGGPPPGLKGPAQAPGRQPGQAGQGQTGPSQTGQGQTGQGEQKGPAVVNQPPPPAPPAKATPGAASPPPPQGQPKVVNQPPAPSPAPPPAAKGPQQQLQPPPPVKVAPPPPPQVKAPPPPSPPPQVKAPPPPPPPPQVKAAPPPQPPAPPPQVKAAPPPPAVQRAAPPPPPPQAQKAAPPPHAQKGPPPGKGPPGRKCEVVNGQPVCK